MQRGLKNICDEHKDNLLCIDFTQSNIIEL